MRTTSSLFLMACFSRAPLLVSSFSTVASSSSRCHLSIQASLSSNRPSSSPSLSTSDVIELSESAIDVLNYHSSKRVPIDTALRRYARFKSLDSNEHDILRNVLFGVARRRYRLDWMLKRAGLERTHEKRVIAAIGGGYVDVKDNPGSDVVDRLMTAHPWLSDLADGPALECDGMDLQTRLECPDWAWDGLNTAFPTEDELSRQLRALQGEAPLDLRVNTLKCPDPDDALDAILAAGFEATPTPYSPLGIRMKHRVPLGKIPGLLDGVVEPQDEGSQLVASFLEAKPGEKVADFCAGTGGKTLQIAAQMENKGRLFAMDVDGARLERGKSRCAKAGVGNVQRRVIQGDMTKRDKWLKRQKLTFDRVLVDAPCSGVGSWRRKPDARWTWAEFDDEADEEGDDDGGDSGSRRDGRERLADLLPLQQQILKRASRLVKPGGRLVYVTCSLLPEENEMQVEEFLAADEQGSGWTIDPQEDFAVPFEVGEGRYLRLTPAQHGTDGFFAAVLTRIASA